MFFSLLISYKETLEAALIIGSIVLYLISCGKNIKILYLYLGAAVGLLFSIFIIFFGFNTIQSFAWDVRYIVQAAALFFMSFLMIFFVVLINKRNNPTGKYISKNLHHMENSAGLFSIAFFIEFKEGIELTLLNLGSLNNSAISVISGTIIGMVMAVISAYIFFIKAAKLNIQLVLKIASVFLVIAAGLMLGQSIFMFIPIEAVMFKLLINILFISLFLLIYLKTSVSLEKG